MKRFLITHVEKVLSSFENILRANPEKSPALDNFVKKYFLIHKNLGSHDRSFVSEAVFRIVRHKIFLDKICQ